VCAKVSHWFAHCSLYMLTSPICSLTAVCMRYRLPFFAHSQISPYPYLLFLQYYSYTLKREEVNVFETLYHVQTLKASHVKRRNVFQWLIIKFVYYIERTARYTSSHSKGALQFGGTAPGWLKIFACTWRNRIYANHSYTTNNSAECSQWTASWIVRLRDIELFVKLSTIAYFSFVNKNSECLAVK
jgi:hypothetical protein